MLDVLILLSGGAAEVKASHRGKEIFQFAALAKNDNEELSLAQNDSSRENNARTVGGLGEQLVGALRYHPAK